MGRPAPTAPRVSMLKLGSLVLDTPVLQAPIAGFTDSIFRNIVRDFGGCGLMFTEMVSAEAWMLGGTLPARLKGVADEPRPLGVQLWGRDPTQIRDAAHRLSDLNVSLIDLNFGCPARRIMGKHGAGATLLRDPATVGKMVAAAVAGAGGVPVTAKIRLGPSLNARTAPEVARRAADNGAVAITVHGRTADQNYGVPSRFDSIAEVTGAVGVPVIANGDIADGAAAVRALGASAAAGVMVARAALTRPWVFREITAALRGEPIPPPPTLGEQKAQLLQHHAAIVERAGDPLGTILMRKFACRYLLGVAGSNGFRDAISRAENAADFRTIVERYFPEDSTVLLECGASVPVAAV